MFAPGLTQGILDAGAQFSGNVVRPNQVLLIFLSEILNRIQLYFKFQTKAMILR